ncbi:MAG: CPBP family intramembrane metalloprotease [Spirochaetes bacterium]|nr:CPBP family intramembrane metalloprotease [Spirochaetota bacterium]
MLARLPALLLDLPLSGTRPSSSWLWLSALAALLQLCILLVALPRLLPGRPLLRRFPTARQILAAAVVWLFFFIVTMLLQLIQQWLAAEGLAGHLPSEGGLSPLLPGAAYSLPWLAAALVFALSIGYQEELLYRFWLPRFFSPWTAGAAIDGNDEFMTSGLPGILLAALLFAFGHLYQGWTAFAGALLLALGLSFALRRGISLHSLALGHAAWNLFVLLNR